MTFTIGNIVAMHEVFENAMETMDKECTWHVPLLSPDGKNAWAVVFAWMDYDETNDWRFYGKIACQPWNSLMQEYDIDWVMPYDEKTGDVWNTELSIERKKDLSDAIDWWNKELDAIWKAYGKETA